MLKIDLENHFYDQSVINALAERTEPPYCTSDHSSIQWTNLIDMPQEKLLPLLLDVGEMRKKKMEKTEFQQLSSVVHQDQNNWIFHKALMFAEKQIPHYMS